MKARKWSNELSLSLSFIQGLERVGTLFSRKSNTCSSFAFSLKILSMLSSNNTLETLKWVIYFMVYSNQFAFFIHLLIMPAVVHSKYGNSSLHPSSSNIFCYEFHEQELETTPLKLAVKCIPSDSNPPGKLTTHWLSRAA